MIDIERLRRYFVENRVFTTRHSLKRFKERGITQDDVRNATDFGEIIEQYPDDYPYPSCLICGKNLRGEIIHAVLSDEGSESKIITTYFPYDDEWSDDFKIRR